MTLASLDLRRSTSATVAPQCHHHPVKNEGTIPCENDAPCQIRAYARSSFLCIFPLTPSEVLRQSAKLLIGCATGGWPSAIYNNVVEVRYLGPLEKRI